MENVNKGNHNSETNATGPAKWDDQNQVVNEQEQNSAVNTGDQEYKENVAGRTQEQPPKDLNLSGSTEEPSAGNAEGGAEIETPHRHEGDDDASTERKIPKM